MKYYTYDEIIFTIIIILGEYSHFYNNPIQTTILLDMFATH